jgi:phosphoribosyl-ATP pyrophosphohydrolase
MSEHNPNIADMIGKIFDFNEQVIGTAPSLPLNPLTEKQFNWTKGFVLEELDEFSTAYAKQDMVGMVDGVLDLVYGAMGTLKKMGLTREQVQACFDAIHTANMTKKKGMTSRGSEEDAAKPAEFMPPDRAIGAILFGPEGM